MQMREDRLLPHQFEEPGLGFTPELDFGLHPEPPRHGNPHRPCACVCALLTSGPLEVTTINAIVELILPGLET